MEHLRSFAKYLFTKYRPRTVQKVLLDLCQLSSGREPRSLERKADLWRAWKAYYIWRKHHAPHAPELARPWFEFPQRSQLNGCGRKYDAVSLDERSWRALIDAVRDSAQPADCVIHVLAVTGLRIGDVLRLSPRALASALERPDGLLELEVKGGKMHRITVNAARDAWEQLALYTRSTATNIAEAVSGDPDAEATGHAYRLVRQRLLELARRLGIEGRCNLHRLRRTVAVRALERGVSADLVREAFGHSDLRTTSQYIDEGLGLQASATIGRALGFNRTR